jgi:hypothetical protein
MFSSRFLVAVASALALATSQASAQSPAARKADPTVELLAKLRKPVDWARADAASVNDLINQIVDKFGIPVLINEAAFKPVDPPLNTAAPMLKISAARALSLSTVLPQILGQFEATYLVRKDHLEIVPIEFAMKETKNIAPNEDEGTARPDQPLVSMIFKEKPLNEAVAELAEEYNLTVIVSPQSADARMGFVTARILNTPADKALELLTLQCDLRIVRKGNSFLITSRDHANDLFNERMEHERAKIDLERSRNAPLAPPPQPQLQPLIAPMPQPAVNPPPKQP